MKKFDEFISDVTINWLLEDENPSVKYYTLVDLLGKTFDDEEVATAKEQIMKTGTVPKILSKQEPGGYWGIQNDFYVRSKYKGTVWNLIILAELGADSKDSCIRKTCEFICQIALRVPLISAHYVRSNGWHVRLLPVGSTLQRSSYLRSKIIKT